MYLAAGDFKKSLLWRNKMFENCDVTVKEDILCSSKIINLINHFELGNTDVLQFMLRSTYRYLGKKERIFKHEKLILDFIRKLCNKKLQPQLPKLFLQLRDDLFALQQDPYEKSAFNFDIISWLDSKIEEKTFQEIVKNKVVEKHKMVFLLQEQE